jgi:hypothetical protein
MLLFLIGLSSSAQMEQIDQLNTLLLQEIDENFAKFHQVVTSHVLPEVKRFALASEPTREAATVSTSVTSSHLRLSLTIPFLSSGVPFSRERLPSSSARMENSPTLPRPRTSTETRKMKPRETRKRHILRTPISTRTTSRLWIVPGRAIKLMNTM